MKRKPKFRKGWLVGIAISGIITLIIGQIIFKQSSCQILQHLLLYFTTALTVIFFAFVSIFARDDALVAKLFSYGCIIIIGILFPSFAGSILARIPEVKSVYCPSCAQEIEIARRLREEKKEIGGAISLARPCFNQATDIQTKTSAAHELVLDLIEEARILTENRQCADILLKFDEAERIANQYGFTDLIIGIEESTKIYHLTCDPISTPLPTEALTPSATPKPTTPAPSPTPKIEVEVLHSRKSDKSALIDVRVLVNGVSRSDLAADDFNLFVAGKAVLFSFEARDADDPVCLIAVVDDSGSVFPGVDEIEEALQKLNDSAKPSDELGLVIFAEPEQVRIERGPTSEDLPTDRVTGSGKYTSLWDGILMGFEAAKSCKTNNYYLFVLTDGRDTGSRHLEGDNLTRARKIASMASEQGVNICTVGVESSQELQVDPLKMASYGCSYYSAKNFDDLADLFQTVFGYVRDFYRFNFASDAIPTDGRIVLKVMNLVEVPVDLSQP